MVSLEDVRRAAEAIRAIAHRTPLLTCRSLDEAVGYPVFLKAESLQKVGAFKIRGASNWLARAKEEGIPLKGVITYSSGNHGQAVALAARRHGLPALVVVPGDASKAKLAAIRGYGAEVEVCGRTSDERKRGAEAIAARNGYALIPPFDDPWIVAGQGTAALEILEERPELRSLVVPVGGGGLISGCATAAKALSPEIRVYGVQPERADSLARSLEEGRLVSIHAGETMGDGLRANAPGKLNFEICRSLVDRAVRVSEEEMGRAVVFLLTRAKILVEPSGAAGVAALLAGKLKPPHPCAAILSGGNVEPERLAELIGRYAT